MEVPVGATNKNAMVPMTTIDTRNILFICGGAFPELDKIIKKRLTSQASIGFQADLKDKYDKEENLLRQVTTEDIRKFGMIPEFIGRVPVDVTLQSHDATTLKRILTTPKNALVKQYQKLLEYDDVDLEFTDDALGAIADKAIERNIGARGLRAVMEGLLTQIMYDIPSDKTVVKAVITKDCVEGKSEPELTHDPEKINYSVKLKSGRNGNRSNPAEPQSAS